MNSPIRIENLKKEFQKRFGSSKGIRIFSAPGRVNLIGEHTDYNGGFVLPIAIDRNILVAARANDGKTINLQSLNFAKRAACPINRIKYAAKDGWANYPKGVAMVLQERGYKLKGMDLLFEGNIPIGSGLSSSAAIEVAACLALTKLSAITIDKKEIPLVCQRAENEFIGMKCGIMDQFVITFAKKSSALFLDCRNLKYKHIPIRADGLAIVIADSKVRRKLVDSEYNSRRKECERGAKILKLPLRDMSPKQFEKYKNNLLSPTRQRCAHVIYENERVKDSARLLKGKKFAEFGKLMNTSHRSLKNLYEVSCPALDTLVDAALKVKGVLGSRMTGAGFGGCTVSLVKKSKVAEFIKTVSAKYQKKFRIKPEFYICKIEDGAKKI